MTESYDALGRRTQLVDTDGTVHNYTYDAAGNLTSASDGAETFTYSYTPLERSSRPTRTARMSPTPLTTPATS